ncbi:MAG: SUMF1/EgtB/PvdO family nonheme iron enzyme [Fibrobacterota bacterium]|nr:SUMF1/EgtB/PvdO family nonheme iron enzyme [Chitinispirillaceae bacterium]
MFEKAHYALLGDIPILEGNRKDLLQFDSCAQVLARAALETPESITIGIFGKWGTGKTSMMRLIKANIEEIARNEKTHAVPVWFNAWQYEKEEHLIVPLTATITRAIDKELKDGKWNEKFLKAAKSVRDALRSIAYGFEVKGKIGIPLVSEAEINLSGKDMIERYQDLTKDSVLARSLYFDAFEQLENCAKSGADSPRIIVFIDDLDRCFPPKAVALLEGIKLVLNQPGFSFVMGIHDEIISEFVKTKYSSECGIDGSHFEDYLDKIIQVKVPVPEREADEMNDYITQLLNQTGVIDKNDIAGLVNLIAESCNRNPRSIVRMLNRIMVTVRIGEIDKKKYEPTALILDMATDSEKYRHFKSILDETFQLDEGEGRQVTFGKLVVEIIKRNESRSGDKREIRDELGDIKLRSRETDLKKVCIMLGENRHIESILKTQAGQKWLEDTKYRKTLMHATRQTIGEQRQEVRQENDPVSDIVNNMVTLPEIEFTMGDKEFGPCHHVTLSSFSLGAMPITQKQYLHVMGQNPSNFVGDNQRPVECVSWDNACKFCDKLSQLTGKKFRLPTEAEWEYACRAGSTGAYCIGDNVNELTEYAWFNKNSDRTTHPVAKKKPNKFGLYDMHGNVWEWCSDRYRDYSSEPVSNPIGPDKGSYRVLRGGSWVNDSGDCRCAARYCRGPSYCDGSIGFRVVFVL